MDPMTIKAALPFTVEALAQAVESDREVRAVLSQFKMENMGHNVPAIVREVCSQLVHNRARIEKNREGLLDSYARAAMPEAMAFTCSAMGADKASQDCEGWADRAAQLAWRMALSMWQYRRVDGQ